MNNGYVFCIEYFQETGDTPRVFGPFNTRGAAKKAAEQFGFIHQSTDSKNISCYKRCVLNRKYRGYIENPHGNIECNVWFDPLEQFDLLG